MTYSIVFIQVTKYIILLYILHFDDENYLHDNQCIIKLFQMKIQEMITKHLFFSTL